MSENQNNITGPGRIKKIAHALQMSPQVYAEFVDRAGARPNREQLRNQLDHFFLVVGSLFFLAGVASFVAYNWADLHKFSKFLLLQLGVLVCVVQSWHKGIDRSTGKAFLFAAAILVGLNMAVYGQVYQTGADPYGLFLGWAIFTLGWVIIGQQAGLYALFVLLANLALIFYWNQVVDPPESDILSGLLGPLFRVFVDSGKSQLPLLILALNGVFMLFFEFLQKRFYFFSGRMLTRITGFLILLPLTSSAVRNLFSRDWLEKSGFIIAAFLAFVGFGLWYFRFKKTDLFLSAGILLATIVFNTSLMTKLLNENLRLSAGAFFFLAVVVLAQTYGAGVWLRKAAVNGGGNE